MVFLLSFSLVNHCEKCLVQFVYLRNVENTGTFTLFNLADQIANQFCYCDVSSGRLELGEGGDVKNVRGVLAQSWVSQNILHEETQLVPIIDEDRVPYEERARSIQQFPCSGSLGELTVG